MLDLIEAGKSPVFVAGALKRTTQSILNRARKLTKIGNDLNGAFTKKLPRWTLEEDKRLRRLAEEGRSAEVISERTKRSIDSVPARAQRLEILLKRRLTLLWTVSAVAGYPARLERDEVRLIRMGIPKSSRL